MHKEKEIAVFGGGCFWCTEATFAALKGVRAVVPGYAGGTVPNPSYEHVCTGATGHAEVVHVEFDPALISYADLLTVFFSVHDPTTPNRQGNDAGTQYRSVILYTTDDQRRQAEAFIKNLEINEFKGSKIVTEIKPLDTFFEAEKYHHEYFKKNPDAAYCQLVVNPKVQKMKQKFSHLLK